MVTPERQPDFHGLLCSRYLCFCVYTALTKQMAILRYEKTRKHTSVLLPSTTITLKSIFIVSFTEVQSGIAPKLDQVNVIPRIAYTGCSLASEVNSRSSRDRHRPGWTDCSGSGGMHLSKKNSTDAARQLLGRLWTTCDALSLMHSRWGVVLIALCS